MLGIIPLIRALVILATIITVAVGGYYIINLKADLAISESNNAQLKAGIEEQQALMARMQADIATIQDANRQLAETAAQQRADVDALSRKFSQDAKGAPRDFGQFAAGKPELVERLVNRGTRNAMRCLELASGAPHTPEELAATTSSEINKECPSIANPNYRGAVK
jgi:hypothetical protein